MKVEVIFPLPYEQVLFTVNADEGCSAREAIEASGILLRYPQIDLAENKIGIFGHAVTMDYVMLPGDRIEIYRPITCDPKEVRRQRADLAKQNKAKAAG